MKYIFRLQWGYWIAFLVLVSSGYCQAQHEPFRGANMIILSTSLADKEAYQTIMQILAEQPIGVTVNTDGLLIRSGENSSLAAKGLVFEGQLVVNTGIVKLSGRIFDMADKTGGSAAGKTIAIAYTKSRTSLQTIGFLYMDELARKLQAALRGPIMYKYQESII
ncbi:hypothetical protein [Spirosoma fluminis]